MMTTSNTITLSSALKAGLIAGLIGAGINHLWSFLAGLLGATIPPGFAVAVTISSLLPVLVGAFLFFIFKRYMPKGQLVWMAVSIAFLLFSFYPVFTSTQFPDGTVLDDTFPLLTAPMHFFSGFLAIWGIPKWSK